METRKRNISLESILVMILLIIFAISACTMIIQGSQSYDSILEDKENAENARIALSYINMRVKQNDVGGKISLEKSAVEGRDALMIKHSGEEEGYLTYIFWSDNKLWECYTDALTEPSITLSSQIVSLDGLSFDFNEKGQTLQVSVKYQYGKDLLNLKSIIALRSNVL
ncbi:MAG: DUF4860 domain-containing protein [Vallitaleaceae bacterium]|nr:DUF4860 domain-containing protein [Vallitaleaceae bacterium]